MVLVLGGTGIVGASLVMDLLLKETAVSVFYRSESKKQKLIQFLLQNSIAEKSIHSINWKKGNLNDYESLVKAFKGVSHLYHCANFVSFNEKDREKLFEINHQGTQNVVNIALENSIKKLVFVSSVATLDKEDGSELLTENNSWDVDVKHSSYEESKNLAEMEVWRASQEGLNVVIIKPGVILNSYDFRQSSGAIFSTYAKNRAFYTQGSVSCIDAKDVSQIMIFMMNSNIINQQFITVSETVSYKNMAEIIRKNYHLSAPKLVSKKQLQILSFLQPVLQFFSKSLAQINPLMVESLTSNTQYSSQKLQKVYPNTLIPVEESLHTHSLNYKKQILDA